ncbi:18773_t:CDS:2, partial [Funneliformis geosporum]
NTMNTVCSVEWRILEIPVESSKARRNTGINTIVDKVLEAKCADGLARLWQSHEEVFLYEQTGSPNFDDITQFHIHDYKLIRTMRDVLNQRIIFRLKNGICDHKDLACFSAFGNRFEVSLFWLTIHQKSYCLREYGTFNIPSTWQELPVLSEAIITCLKFFSFMKENIEVRNSYVGQNQKLLAKRRVHSVKQNQSSP